MSTPAQDSRPLPPATAVADGTRTPRSGVAAPVLALVVDVLLICFFATRGRLSHELGIDVGGVLLTAAPFLLAYALGALVTRHWITWSQLWPAGMVVWVITVVGGILLRVTAFQDTAAWSFQLVTALFLAAMLLGRRLITTLFRTWRRRRSRS